MNRPSQHSQSALGRSGGVPVVQMKGIHTRFGKTVIHNGIDLDIYGEQIVALVGGSGSGKTTLVREMVGLLVPNAGEVKLFGSPVMSNNHIINRDLRRRFGMLFQRGALFSAFSVFDNIAFPLRELRILDEALIRDLVWMKLEMVELEAAHGLLMPSELSGGMIKRVALARALALEPELLLLDEPTAGLDPDLSTRFVKLIQMLQKNLKFTVVMVTHDLDTLAELATRVVVLADQKIVADGAPTEVLTVKHPFIQNFFCPERLPDSMKQRTV